MLGEIQKRGKVYTINHSRHSQTGSVAEYYDYKEVSKQERKTLLITLSEKLGREVI